MSEPVDNLVTRTVSLATSQGAPTSRRAYLLVIEDGSSRMVSLPAAGVLRIGRGSDCDLVIAHPSVSREHARVTVTDGIARVADLGSHNGTRVNGEAIAAPRALVSGDVIGVGEATLVFHADRRAPADRRVIPLETFQGRLEEEVDRAVTCERPVALVVIALGAASIDALDITALGRVLRTVDTLGRAGDAQLLALLPERGPEDARATANQLLQLVKAVAPDATCGVATCPIDGCEPEALLVGARAAALRGAAYQAGTSLDLDGRKVILAHPVMFRLYELIKRLANADLPILILGETGVGKENAAYAVHHYSARRAQPFMTLNCAAIPETLVESELFGHEKGSFSGATAAHAGILERTAGGTLFLDEVGEFSLAVQAKLLRALEQKRVTRIGDVRERTVDARIVAATNRDLEAEVAAGRFRQDLYFRLCAATVVLPPLRERVTEIPILARAFLAEACTAAAREPMELTPSALQALARHPWPGNVRELRNLMLFLAAAVQTWTIEAQDLPASLSRARPPMAPAAAAVLSPPTPSSGSIPAARPLADEIRELERTRMREALSAANGVKTRAAQLLGMPIRTFSFKLKQHGLLDGDTQPSNE